MGHYETPSELESQMTSKLPSGVFIVANEAAVDALESTGLAHKFGDCTFVPLPADSPLPNRALHQARVLVVEVNPAKPASLSRIGEIRKARPNLPIIVAINEADVSLTRTLIRQGVYDVADLPFAPDELEAQVLDATATLTSLDEGNDLAPMITVVRSAGGCGATTVITHLAAALAELDTSGRGVCVVDLDLQNGEVAPYVSLEPTASVSSLLDAGERLDDELLLSTSVQSGYGFSVIAAPNDISPIENVDVDQMLKILRMVRKRFGIVLVDLPANWTNWSVSAALASSELVLVTDLSIGSLRQAKRRLNLLAYFDILPKQVKVVVNKVERRMFKTISLNEVAETLRSDVIASLSDEGRAMQAAQDQGMLITDTARNSKFAGQIQELARRILESGA